MSNQHSPKTAYSYKSAGVDIDAGEALVEAIKPLAASTRRKGANADLGGFGGLFDLRAAGFQDPILVSGTDGVGTKLKVAIEAGLHKGIGIDLVAMCVNDIVVVGAEPLFFLDYYATGKLDIAAGRAIVEGIAEGCRQAGAALIGGETAEMPGMYSEGHYDLAGFAAGAAERGTLLRKEAIEPGDVILGLASSGIHSNGYSLVRRIVEGEGFRYDAPCPFAPGITLGEALLEPTRVYVKSCLAAHHARLVHGFAHITGGGFLENVPRCLPKDTAAMIDAGAWELPPVFRFLKEKGDLHATEMVRTFNCGIGMVAVVPPGSAEAAMDIFRRGGETVYCLGEIVEHKGDPVTLMTAAPGVWGYRDGFSATTSGH